MFEETLMQNRPRARPLRLAGLVIAAPIVAIPPLIVAFILCEVFIIAPLSGRGLFASGLESSLLIYFAIAVILVFYALPFMIIGLIVGHVATPRRPLDGAVLGGIGTSLCLLAFSASMGWELLAYIPLTCVGALMGWGVTRLGYDRARA